MLGFWRSHADYQVWLKSKLRSLVPYHESQIRYYHSLIEKLYVLDLDPLKEIIAPLYSPLGRPAQNQPELFRVLVAMVHCKIEDPTKFVHLLKSNPVLATICGFNLHTPGVGTIYDFLNRLWLEFAPQKAVQKPKPKGRKRPKSGEKLVPKHPGIVKKLVNQVLKGRVLKKQPQRILQLILKECAVKPSSELGLLGDPDNVAVAADGAPLLTGANPYGKKLCECHSKGIFRCSCKRSFTDPNANWGWDSYHEQWFYGHTLYSITSANSPNDLPLLLNLVQASRHDSVTFVFAWAELLELYPEFRFTKAILDSAHDVYDIYRLLAANNTEAFIDLNKRAKGKSSYPCPVSVNDNGVPICPAGLPMVNWGFQQDRCRIKWRCPNYMKLDLCPNHDDCSPSKYGRVIYTKPNWDLRLFTPTPRGSQEWKETYARRTSVERTFKRILVDYKIEQARARSKKRWFWQALLAAINQHLDAQISVIKPNILAEIGLSDFQQVA